MANTKKQKGKILGIVFVIILILVVFLISIFAGIFYKYYKTMNANDYLTPVFENQTKGVEKMNDILDGLFSGVYQNNFCSSCGQ